MTIIAFVNRLDGWKRTKRGYIARCPAHADHSPSLSIREADDGRIMIYCFAGCTVDSICQAISCRVADLFPKGQGHSLRSSESRPPRFDWQSTAWRFQFHAFLLWLRAAAVLEAAKELDASSWSDKERDQAMQAVANAHRDLDRSDLLEGIAFGIRTRGLESERHVHHTHAA